MDSSKPAAALPHRQIVFYALPSLVTSVVALPLALFIPAFYADDLGVPLATVGIVIALSRLLDIVTDPLIGATSDHMPARWGRRKPWMLLGTPVFAVALWQVFVPGDAAGAGHLMLWSAVLYLGFTMIDLPHKAWGAELSVDYDQRSRITSWREGLATLGQVLLLASLVWLASRGIEDAATQLRGIALAVIVALPLLVLTAVRTVPEGTIEGFAHESRRPLEGLKLVMRNPAFTRMVGCVVLFVSGVAIQGTLHRMVLTDVMGAEDRFPLMILVENVATLAAVPLWLRLSLSIGKHRALIAAALWLAVLSLPLMLLRSVDVTTMIALVALRGSSFASILFLSGSIAADVIDVDTLASGRQRTGLFFAVWGMAIKLALALGVLLGTVLPAVWGYDPTLDVTPDLVQTRLLIVYGGVPALLMAGGALCLRGFPITRHRHAQVRAELEAKQREEQ